FAVCFLGAREQRSLLKQFPRSLWGLIVFAFPLESSCISFAGFVLFKLITIFYLLIKPNICYSLLWWSIGAKGSRRLREKPQRCLMRRLSAVPVPAADPTGSGFCCRGS